MLPGWAVIVTALLYLLILFGVANYGDTKGRWLMRGRARSIVYALTLGVYCTSWTFLGSVGVASRSGLDFLTIYIGPVLVFLFGGYLLTRMVTLAKTQNITSVADFVAARYGKNQGVAAAVALIAVIGIVPYIALRLKAISLSLGVCIASGGFLQAGAATGFGDLSLLVALILSAFAIAFGTRQIDATEHQDGLMLAIAMESVVKLIAFLAVGIYITFGMFDGPASLLAKAAAHPQAASALQFDPSAATWLTMISLSAIAILLLPRQFHTMIVENRDVADLKPARWMFPAYLIAINLFVVPIAAAGLLMIDSPGFDRDLTVLALPLAGEAPIVALIALIGGLSAATAMVIVETVALAIMVSNDLAIPLILRWRSAAADSRHASADMGGLVLKIRRVAIIALLILAYIYYRVSGNAALAQIGLLSFAAIAQIAPVFLGGLFWRNGNARGAVAGLSAGIAVWAYTLFLPSLATPGSAIQTLIEHGPFGITLLRPTALLGFGGPQLVHGFCWSLGLNILLFILVSRSRAATAIERLQANIFVAPEGTPVAPNFRLWRASVTVEELRATVARYLGHEHTAASFAGFAASRGEAPDGKSEADLHTLRHAELLLSSAIGAASSRQVLSLLIGRRNVSPSSALKLLDDASAAIQYNRDLLQHALNHTEQAVTVFDRGLALAAWNRAFQEIFGLPPNLMRAGIRLDEIIRHNALSGLYGEGNPETFVRARMDSLVNDREPFRLRLHPSGQVLEIRSNTLPDGGFVTTYTDVTAAVRAEEELERANETLEKRVAERTEEITRVNGELGRAKAAADEANLSKTRFLAAASHDILQPLNAARLYTSALVERDPPAAIKDLAGNVDASLEAVEEIITALLDISRLDAGAMKPDISVFAIAGVFRQLSVEFGPMAAAKGLKMTFVTSSLHIRSDRRLLRRLLQNLVSNAIKYTVSGRILVGCRRSGGSVSIMVRDTGIGIPKPKQRLVFREFLRLDEGVKAARGLGLGLSIVERIGRVLGHSIALSSAPGRGTAFTIQAPAESKAPALAETIAEIPVPQTALTGMSVLAIDNEPAILDGMRRLLEGWGCRIVTVADGAGAKAALRRNGNSFDAVLADFHLDSGTGLELIAELRGIASVSLRAALVTADRSLTVRDAAAAMQVLVLNKPLKPAALRATLSQWRMSEQVAAE